MCILLYVKLHAFSSMRRLLCSSVVYSDSSDDSDSSSSASSLSSSSSDSDHLPPWSEELSLESAIIAALGSLV